MSRPTEIRFWVAAVIAALSLSLLPLDRALSDASLSRAVSRGFEVERGVRLRNVAGKVTVGPAEDAQTVATATVHAEADTREDAEELLNSIDLSFEKRSGVMNILVRYPLDEHRVYRYPERGRRGDATSRTTYDGKRVTVTTRRDRKAVTLWVDVELKLAPGVGVDIEQLAGDVDVSAVKGDVAIENGWGDISLVEVEGEVVADTGSGKVDVRAQKGAVEVDTGSGPVNLEDVQGPVEADTGSGDVTVTRVAGDVWIDTGSGDVEVIGVSGSIDIDTGSGDTRIEDAESEDITVDTGSGTVLVESPDLFRSPAMTEASFDTGSGDVILVVDKEVSMYLDFSGSGRLRCPRSLSDRLERIGRRDDQRYRFGEGESRVSVDTGSGDVILRLAGR